MLVTLSDTKTFLGITDNSSDTLITSLILSAQDEIFNDIKNKFATNTTLTSSTIAISANSIVESVNSFTDYGFIKGKYWIIGSNYNNALIDVSNVTSTTLTVVDTLIAESQGSQITLVLANIPNDVKLCCMKMVSFGMANKNGADSETFNKYSITYNKSNSSKSYPDQIISRLGKYRRFYFDR